MDLRTYGYGSLTARVFAFTNLVIAFKDLYVL